jgi:hypothetical protein
MTNAAATKVTDLLPGQRTDFAVPNTSAVISVQRTHTGTYTLVTNLGSHRVESWCEVFATATEARDEAIRTVKAFHAHGTDIAIDRARNAACIAIAYQEARKARRMCNVVELAKANAIADALTDFDTKRVGQRMAADFNARNAA